jgi:hypothetical protein
VARHIGHFAVHILRKPVQQMSFVFAKVNVTYTNLLKAEFLAPALNLLS